MAVGWRRFAAVEAEEGIGIGQLEEKRHRMADQLDRLQWTTCLGASYPLTKENDIIVCHVA